MQQLGVEEQRPAFGLYFFAGIGLAANLSGRNTHQGVAVKVVGSQAVSEIPQGFVADEDAIDIVVVERMAAMLQLVVVDDRDERMQHGRTDVTGVVVDAVNFQYLFHYGCKDTHFLPFSVILVKQSVFN